MQRKYGNHNAYNAVAKHEVAVVKFNVYHSKNHQNHTAPTKTQGSVGGISHNDEETYPKQNTENRPTSVFKHREQSLPNVFIASRIVPEINRRIVEIIQLCHVHHQNSKQSKRPE
jgi:hypothetical protein